MLLRVIRFGKEGGRKPRRHPKISTLRRHSLNYIGGNPYSIRNDFPNGPVLSGCEHRKPDGKERSGIFLLEGRRMFRFGLDISQQTSGLPHPSGVQARMSGPSYEAGLALPKARRVRNSRATIIWSTQLSRDRSPERSILFGIGRDDESPMRCHTTHPHLNAHRPAC